MTSPDEATEPRYAGFGPPLNVANADSRVWVTSWTRPTVAMVTGAFTAGVAFATLALSIPALALLFTVHQLQPGLTGDPSPAAQTTVAPVQTEPVTAWPATTP